MDRAEQIRTAEGILAVPTPRVVLEAQVAELRAVLAPLLDDPEIYTDEGLCIFCRQYEQVWNRAEQRYMEYKPHEPDCPVLRKDALLGR